MYSHDVLIWLRWDDGSKGFYVSSYDHEINQWEIYKPVAPAHSFGPYRGFEVLAWASIHAAMPRNPVAQIAAIWEYPSEKLPRTNDRLILWVDWPDHDESLVEGTYCPQRGFQMRPGPVNVLAWARVLPPRLSTA